MGSCESQGGSEACGASFKGAAGVADCSRRMDTPPFDTTAPAKTGLVRQSGVVHADAEAVREHLERLNALATVLAEHVATLNTASRRPTRRR